MEDKLNSLESLIGQLEEYGTTSVELLKLKAVEKVADTSSVVLSRVIVMPFLVSFLIILNLGLSFWLGEVLGKVYYGFFVVAAIYALLTIVFMCFHNTFRIRLKDYLIAKLLN